MGEVLDNPEQLSWFARCDRKLFGSIHKSNAVKKPYVIIDVDAKIRELLRSVIESIGIDRVFAVTETRGGYHVFIKRDVLGKWWAYVRDELRRLSDIEILNHNQTPIVGTFQGGRVVKFVSFKTEIGFEG